MPAELIADMLIQGTTPEEIREGYPALDRERVELAPLYVQVSAPRPSGFPPLGKTKTGSCNPAWPCRRGMTVKVLIDECLHTSLVELAGCSLRGRSCQLSGSPWFERLATHGHHPPKDYAFVTNNRSDFLALHGREPLHAGVIIIVPSVAPDLSARTLQRGAQTYRRTGSRQYSG
jgi:hypothetical protein